MSKPAGKFHRASWSSAARDSLVQLARTPFNLLFNVLLIAIAVSLPVVLDLGVDNIKQWAGYRDNDLQITVYLNDDVDQQQASALTERIGSWPGVDKSDYISSEQALATLQQQEMFAEALRGLNDNPLPASLVVSLPHDPSISELATELVEKIEQEPGVDWVLFDLDWFNKAEALISTGESLNSTLTAFLSLSVCLVIANSVRHTIDNRREEILVSKLVGATDSYVRQPFLLMGMWVGVLGAALGLIMAAMGWWLLGQQMTELGLAYDGDISLSGLAPGRALAVLGSAALFGLLGAWLICNRQLGKISPE